MAAGLLGASFSVWESRSRLLGNGFKIKSVTSYCSQSEKGTQPRGGGKFATRPWRGEGGIGKEEKSGSPSVNWKGVLKFPFLLPEGRGSLQSGGTGDRGLVSSLTQRDSSGREGGK